jgi:hypothetical protein
MSDHDAIRAEIVEWPEEYSRLSVSRADLAALLADRDALERERRRLANVYAGICVRLVRAGVTAFGDAGGAIDMLAADRDALARDLAAARGLLRDLHGAMRARHYGRMPEEVQRAYDAAGAYLAATPEREPAKPLESSGCVYCDRQILHDECDRDEREPGAAGCTDDTVPKSLLCDGDGTDAWS